MELLEEIGPLEASDADDADAQQAFHTFAFPAKHGARVIQRLTTACGSLVDMGFPHLKRMKKHGSQPGTLLALVAPVDADDKLNDELRETLQEEYDGTFCIVDVLKRPPQTRDAWTLRTKQWPLIFHASVVPETQVEPLTDDEAQRMVALVRQATSNGVRFRGETNDPEAFCCAMSCLIADPTGANNDTSYSIVADAYARLHKSPEAYGFQPLFHPVMIAIDGVAARDRARSADIGPSKKHRRVESDTTRLSTPSTEVESYLCTGYDVFVDVEPCTMCAMALVHSRARRVVFGRLNATDGALASAHRLHTIKSLNHHYRVFHASVEEQRE